MLSVLYLRARDSSIHSILGVLVFLYIPLYIN